MKKLIIWIVIGLLAINILRSEENAISFGTLLEYLSKANFDFTDTIEAVIEMGNNFQAISEPLSDPDNILGWTEYIGRTIQAFSSVFNVVIKAVQDIVQSLAQLLDIIMRLISPNYSPNNPNPSTPYPGGGGGGGGGSRPI